MRRSRRASASGAPARLQAPRPGYGSWRGMESSGPPPTRPRTFPHPSEILGARPPPAQDYTQASTAATTRSYTLTRETRKEDPRRPPPSTMSRCSSLRSDRWSPSVGTSGHHRRNAQPYRRSRRRGPLPMGRGGRRPDRAARREISLHRATCISALDSVAAAWLHLATASERLESLFQM